MPPRHSSSAETLDRRTNHRQAQPLPQAARGGNLTLPALPVIADANRQLHHVLGQDPEICARRG